VEALRRRFLEGDNAAFEELLTLYMPLLKFITRKYCNVQSERDDYFAETVFGFFHAVRTYNVHKGSFDGYVATVASRRLIDVQRKTARTHVEPIDTFDKRGSAQDDPAADGASLEPAMVSELLSPLEASCFERHLHGETLDMIAGTMGISKSSVSNALARAKRKLGQALS